MKPIDELKALKTQRSREKYPNIPEHARPPARVKINNTNSLTSAVIDFLTLKKHYAVRINTQGQYDEKRGIWRPSGTRKGTADIHACINGRHVSIEIKTGKDRQREEQKRTEEDVIKAGGLYWIVKDFDGFYELYNAL
jgi:hypothetical protein